MENQGLQPSDALQSADNELFEKYAVKPEEAQAYLIHLGYKSKDMWELLDQEPGIAIPIGSHHLRMIARVACSEEPTLLESLDSDRYAYGGGSWDVETVRADSEALKKWFSERSIYPEVLQPETAVEITREEVLEVLQKVDKRCKSPYHLEWDKSVLDGNGCEIDSVKVWVEGGEEADDIVAAWKWQAGKRSKEIGTHAAILEHLFDKATVWFDSGFCDRDYLEDILWDVDNIARAASERGLPELAERARQKVNEINLKIVEEQE